MYYSKSTGGFYDAAIHGDAIPADAVEITAELHAALLEGQSNGKRIVANDDGFPLLANPPAPTFDELKAAKRAGFAVECEKAIASLRAGYPESEVLSWPKQEAEARAFIADAPAATPLLDALADARGIGKSDLAYRVTAKADAFAAYSGALIGKRQKLEDALDALPPEATADDLDAIVW